MHEMTTALRRFMRRFGLFGSGYEFSASEYGRVVQRTWDRVRLSGASRGGTNEIALTYLAKPDAIRFQTGLCGDPHRRMVGHAFVDPGLYRLEI